MKKHLQVKELTLEEINAQESINEQRRRTKYAHFGTSTRDGVVLHNFDETIEDKTKRIRESHLPKKKEAVFAGVPGPGTYKTASDFEIRNLNNPDDRIGKVPKFHFGIKPTIKPQNLFVPGVGNAEVDQAPMWMKNPQYWIGTDVRKDLAVPNSHLYPGPGHYFHEPDFYGTTFVGMPIGRDEYKPPIGGVSVSFTQEKKAANYEKIQQGFEPGPGSYNTYSTVGNVRGYLVPPVKEMQTASEYD